MKQEAVREPVGYGELIRRNANFRNLWFGQIVSLFGDWFNLIASASLIGILTQSGLAVGGLFVVRMLAQFLASIVGGVLADRFNRKRLLIFADFARGLIVLCYLLVQEPGQVWLLYVLSALQMAISGIFEPARNAILPDVVRSEEIGAANALSAATWSTMLAFGAAMGGLVAGEWGVKPAFLIDSLTFFLSAFFIARVFYQKTTTPGESHQQRVLAAFIEQYSNGLRYLKHNRHVLIIAMQKASLAFAVTSVLQIIQVTLAGEYFVMGEGGGTSLGILYAVTGVGTGIGPILTRYFTGDDHKRLRLAVVLGYLVTAAGLLAMSTLGSFEVVLLGSFIRGLGGAMTWVMSTQMLLQLVPNEVRGRVFATEFAMMTLMSAVGSAGGGWLLDNLPVTIPQVMWGMTALVLLIGGAWAAAGLLRESRRTQ